MKFKLVTTRSQGFEHERNDCTVRSLSNAADISYHEAHELCARAGRKPRHGFHFQSWLTEQARSSEGIVFGRYRVHRIELPAGATWRARNVTLAQFLRDFPRGRFILVKRGHAFAVVEGVALDLSSALCGPRSQVRVVFWLEKTGY